MKNKLIMNANDVQAVTAYSIGHCRRIIRRIKEQNNKLKHHMVTVEEVSAYLGIDQELLRSAFSKI